MIGFDAETQVVGFMGNNQAFSQFIQIRVDKEAAKKVKEKKEFRQLVLVVLVSYVDISYNQYKSCPSLSKLAEYEGY